MGYGAKLFHEFFLTTGTFLVSNDDPGKPKPHPGCHPQAPPALLHNLRIGALAPSAAPATQPEVSFKFSSAQPSEAAYKEVAPSAAQRWAALAHVQQVVEACSRPPLCPPPPLPLATPHKRMPAPGDALSSPYSRAEYDADVDNGGSASGAAAEEGAADGVAEVEPVMKPEHMPSGPPGLKKRKAPRRR